MSELGELMALVVSAEGLERKGPPHKPDRRRFSDNAILTLARALKLRLTNEATPPEAVNRGSGEVTREELAQLLYEALTEPERRPWAEWNKDYPTGARLYYVWADALLSQFHITRRGATEKPQVTERERKLVEALAFYANPDTWFATALLCDPPCGEIRDDYGSTEGWEDIASERLGKRAREAMIEGSYMLYYEPTSPTQGLK